MLRLKKNNMILLLILFSFFSLFSLAEGKESKSNTLRGGWYLWDPYQYLEKGQGYTQLNGLDINLEKAIAKQAGYEINFEQVAWKQHLNDLAVGMRDIAAGATKTSDREKYVYFSIPYREESNSLFTLKSSSKKLHFSSVEEFLMQVKKTNFKLGVVDGYVYVDPKINAFIADPANHAQLVPVDNTYENLEHLMSAKIDGFLADRIDGATALWRSSNREKVVEKVIGIVPIHLMFSKKTVSREIVETFNKSIEAVKDSGEYDSIIRSYLFPILLMQTIDRDWFIVIDIIGTVAFAISGLIIAYRERASFFKATVLAALPAVGGSIIRDLIAGRSPIGVLRTPIYVIAIALTVLMAYILIRLMKMAFFLPRPTSTQKAIVERHSKYLALSIDIFDALGLAAFTVIGVTVAFSSRSDPLWVWGPIFAVTTGVGGGIIRDLLREDRVIWALKGEFYAEVPFIWGIFLTVYLLMNKQYTSPEPIFYAVLCTLIGGFMTRLLIVWLNIKPPYFRPRA